MLTIRTMAVERSGPHVAALAAVLWAVATFSAAEADEAVETVQQLIAEVERAGGRGGALVGVERGGATRARGVAAGRAVEEGEVIAEVPLRHCIRLGADDALSAASAAVLLLRARRKGRHAAYFAALPAGGELATAETAEEAELERQLDGSMLSAALESRRATEAAFEAHRGGAHLEGETLATFRHAVALVRSRSLALDGGGQGVLRYAVPLVDLANDGGPGGGNAAVRVRGGSVQLVAGRDIVAGEEVRISYGERLRADDTALVYGFVHDGEVETPRLCTVHARGALPDARSEVVRLEALLDDVRRAGGAGVRRDGGVEELLARARRVCERGLERALVVARSVASELR